MQFKKLTIILCLLTNSSFADPMQITLGGNFDFQYGMRTQSKNYQDNLFTVDNSAQTLINTPNLTTHDRNSKLASQAYIVVKAEQKLDNLLYGANLVLQTVSNNDHRFNKSLNRSYLFAESQNFGRVELGGNEAVSRSMAIGADSLSVRGDEAFNEVMYYYVAPFPSTDLNPPYFLNDYIILSPKTYVNRTPIYYTARKINYYSPKIRNFQFGLSFAPDMANHGDPYYDTISNYQPKMKNFISLAVTYSSKLNNNMLLDLSYVYDHAQSTISPAYGYSYTKRNINSYALGAKLTFDNNLSLAASYGGDGKTSMRTSIDDSWKSRYYSAGASYKSNKATYSLTYNNGTVGDDSVLLAQGEGKVTTSLLALATSYNLAPGFSPYVELNYYQVKYSKDSVIRFSRANSGIVLLTGIAIAF